MITDLMIKKEKKKIQKSLDGTMIYFECILMQTDFMHLRIRRFVTSFAYDMYVRLAANRKVI